MRVIHRRRALRRAKKQIDHSIAPQRAKRRLIMSLALSAASAISASTATATLYTWNFSTSMGSWSSSNNWSPNGVPHAGDIVYVWTPLTYNFHIAELDYDIAGSGLAELAIESNNGPGAGATAYVLQRGHTLVSQTETIVGNAGHSQTGGLNTVVSRLIIGTDYTGRTGRYNLSGTGQLHAGTISLASYAVSQSNDNLVIDDNAICNVDNDLIVGAYNSYGGSGGRLIVRVGGSSAVTVGGSIRFGETEATFNSLDQTGGTVTCGAVIMGEDINTQNAYELDAAGELHTNQLVVGELGTATFSLAGSLLPRTATGVDVIIGHQAGSVGTLLCTAGGGSLRSLTVGYGGAGTVIQSGGFFGVAQANPVVIGSFVDAPGTYVLSGGVLASGTQFVGQFGLGTFNQQGGSNVVAGTGQLVLGNSSNAIGLYNLSGGTVTVGGGGIAVGRGGFGSFTASGGTISCGTMSLGEFSGAQGNLAVSGSARIIASSDIAAGVLGTGVINQNGGTVSTSGFLVLGASASGSGIYTLSGGSLSASSAVLIGNFGLGQLNQSGGGALNSASISLANNSASTGRWYISGSADVHAGAESIGTRGIGWVTQSGGVQTVDGSLSVGDLSGAIGRYDFSGGTIAVGNDLVVGAAGSGSMNQSAGRASAFGVRVGKDANSTGFYGLSGGTLTSIEMDLGLFGTGTFALSGAATHSVNYVSLAYGAGATGTYLQTGGSFTVNNQIYIGAAVGGANAGTLTMSAGSSSFGDMFVGFHSGGRGFVNQTGGTANIAALTIGTDPGSTGTYSLGGSGVLQAGQVYVQSLGAGTLVQSGGSFTASTLTCNGTMLMNGGSALLNNATVPGSLRYNGGKLTAGTLTVQAGGRVLLSTGADKVLSVSTLSIASAAGGGTLDLSDNDMIVRGGNTYSSIAAYIANARNGGAWNRSGLTSSAAAAANPKITTLGLLTGQQFHVAHGASATFDGLTVANTDLLVKYTWYGDADFNGIVDGADYGRTDASFNSQATQGNISGWINGDFDYNGRIDGNDFALLDAAFNSQSGTLRLAGDYLAGINPNIDMNGSPALRMVLNHFQQFGEPYALALINSIPEPSMAAGSLALGASGLWIRRRRYGVTSKAR